MMSLPIITSVIFGVIAFLMVLFILDTADNSKETRVALLVIALCTWAIATSWVLYYR